MLTGALKLFFRELSEPIFPLFMNKDFMSAIRKKKTFFFNKKNFIFYLGEPNIRKKFKCIDDLLQRLPLVNRETLKILFLHLEK